jgi:hypothetical protein
MAYLFLRPFATGHPVAREWKYSSQPCSYTVLKTVDEYEQLIVDPRASAEEKKRTCEVSPLALVSLAGFFVLLLCLLGLALCVGRM